MKSAKIVAILVLALGLISCGGQATFAGSIIGWGLNSSGQATPPNGNDFVAIASGMYHNVALKSDGSLVCWGRNIDGEANPPPGNDFVAVAAGFYFGLALKSDGSIVGWGGSSGASTPPGNDFVAIDGGYRFGLGLKSDGSIVGWGLNDYGQADPCEGNDYVAIAAGASHGLGLKVDGSIVGWGRNDNGEINVPVGNDFIAIATFHSFSAALKSDGSVIQWGAPQDPPPAGNDYAAVAVGNGHGLAIMSDGSLLGWGRNDSNQATPPGGTDFVAVAAGVHHGLALTQSFVSTRFTYQGQLLNDGAAADGVYDFEFKIFRDSIINVQEGKTLSLENIDVIDGQFTVELDFGNDANVFAGKERWLEVAVRPGDSNDVNDFVVLSPRQEVTPTPYAQVASTALGLRITGTETQAVYVDPNGNVGIGTMSPSHLLDVNGSLRLRQSGGGNPAASLIELGNRDGSRTYGINFNAYYDGSWKYRSSDEAASIGFEANGDLVFSTMAYGTADSLLTFSPRITIKNNGNVGVGTMAPTQKLDVAGNVMGNNLYANRYYDRDDTGYYVDPASTSYCNDMRVNILYDRNSSVYYVDPASTSNLSTVYANSAYAGSAYAYAFYDRNNTGYYVDPASTGTSAKLAGWVGIGIGTAAPTVRLDVGGDVKAYRYLDRSNTSYYVDSSSTSYLYSLNVEGSVYMPGVYSHSMTGRDVKITSGGRMGTLLSSKRFKENIAPLEDDFTKILEARPVAFIWKESKEPDIGLIAEDMDELGLRNLVFYDAEGRPDAVRYDFVSLYLLEVLKDQANSIKELKAENESLKEQLKEENQSLKQRLSALERTVQQIAKAKEVKL